jgi:hypothetical protein
MLTENRRNVDTVFIAVTGVVMAVVFGVAPFVHTRALSGDSVLGQAREYEQICQTITPEEAKQLNATRRC